MNLIFRKHCVVLMFVFVLELNCEIFHDLMTEKFAVESFSVMRSLCRQNGRNEKIKSLDTCVFVNTL